MMILARPGVNVSAMRNPVLMARSPAFAGRARPLQNGRCRVDQPSRGISRAVAVERGAWDDTEVVFEGRQHPSLRPGVGGACLHDEDEVAHRTDHSPALRGGESERVVVRELMRNGLLIDVETPQPIGESAAKVTRGVRGPEVGLEVARRPGEKRPDVGLGEDPLSALRRSVRALLAPGPPPFRAPRRGRATSASSKQLVQPNDALREARRPSCRALRPPSLVGVPDELHDARGVRGPHSPA